jgi:NADH-quinone oxidoreductase subunit E
MTLRTVACFGQCALAPVIEVNHAIFGHMNEPTLQRELDALAQQEPRT